MIEIRQLTKKFGEKTVFENADITIPDNSICGLVGRNGAGKSTLLRIISGVLRADSGSLLIDDEAVYENPVIKKEIFFLSDEPYYDFNITGEKLTAFYKSFYSFDGEVFKSYTEKFKLDTKKPIRNFSKGMKRQIFIAAALACAPKYLLLDEAFDGLDPLARLEFKRGLIKLQQQGSTVIIASHSLRELEDICDSFILIDESKVKIGGSIENALENIFKLQIAFEDDITEEQIPFKCLSFEKNGRVVTVVAKGDKAELIERLKQLNPLIVDEIAMDFEDMFIEEVNKKGDGQ